MKLLTKNIKEKDSLLVFDFDGTLKELLVGQSLSEPFDPQKFEILENLAKNYEVSMNTGRNAEQIFELLYESIEIRYYFGNHGVILYDSLEETREYLIEGLVEAESIVQEFHQKVHDLIKQ